MMNALTHGAASAAEIAGALSGVPYVGAAAIVLRDISNLCESVALHRKRALQVANKSALLLNILDDHASRLEGTDLQAVADELEPVLIRIRKRLHKYNSWTLLSCFVHNSELAKGLADSDKELDAAITKFNINSHVILHSTQRETQQIIRADAAETRELLLQILSNQQSMQAISAGQRAGDHVAEHLMAVGQETLSLLRAPDPTGQMQSSASSTAMSEHTFSPSETLERERNRQIEQGLVDLHKETGIPPSVKILNGEVERLGSMPVSGGLYSEVWKGFWLGKVNVALKALRTIRLSDQKASNRVMKEILIWVDLDHPHVLPLFGVVTDIGQQIHMVSPWQTKGDALEYSKQNLNVNKMNLLAGAAQGVQYLHSRLITHGNLKCANVLVSDNEEARICDFGTSKAVEQATEKSASATLTAGASARWQAPELIEGSATTPTFQTDTYSFAMTILELYTLKHPYWHCKRYANVIHEIVVARRNPPRPQSITDDLWALMVQCWNRDALQRPDMDNVADSLKHLKS